MTEIRTPRDLALADRPVTVPELAAVARVSEWYIRECIATGAIEAGRVGRCFRIPAEEARRLAREAGVLSV